MKWDVESVNSLTWEVLIEGTISRLGAAERILKELIKSEITKLVNE